MKTDWEAAALEYTQRGMPKGDWNFGYTKVLELLESPQRVLDYGCGSGKFTRELARRGMQVIGVDPTPKMIELAREQDCQNIEYHCSDNLDFIPSCSLDAALATFVFCGIEDDQKLVQMCNDIYRVLKQDASFVLLEPHPSALGEKYVSGSRRLIGEKQVKTILTGMTKPFYDYLRLEEDYERIMDQSELQWCLTEAIGTPAEYLLMMGTKECGRRKLPIIIKY